MAFFVLSRCFLDISVGIVAFVIGLFQISSFSLYLGKNQLKQHKRNGKIFYAHFNLSCKNNLYIIYRNNLIITAVVKFILSIEN